MNDSLESELKAALEHVLPPTSSSPDWSAVERRAVRLVEAATRRSSRSRFRRPIVLALVGALVVSTAAYAVVRYLVVGSPAPPPVKVSEQLLNRAEATLSVLGPIYGNGTVEVAKTRAAAVLETASGAVVVWVAPTTTGAECAYLEITGLDVRLAHGSPFLMQLQPGAHCMAFGHSSALETVNTSVDGRALSLVVGHVLPPGRTLQLRFTNGQMSRVFPVTNHYVIALGNSTHPRPVPIVRDAAGHVVAKVWFLVPLRIRSSPIGPVVLTVRLRLRYSPGSLTLWAGPAALGGICMRVRFSPGNGGGAAGGGCGPSPAPDGLGIREAYAMVGGPSVDYLAGKVGANVAQLELRTNSGALERIPLHHGWVLYEIDPTNPAVELIARDRQGTIIATRNVRSYPAFTPQPGRPVKARR